MSLIRADLSPERADFLSEKADLKFGRADFRPERADVLFEKADWRSGSANLRPLENGVEVAFIFCMTVVLPLLWTQNLLNWIRRKSGNPQRFIDLLILLIYFCFC